MEKSCENKVRNKNAQITDIKVDTSIVAKRSLLPLIKGYYRESVDPPWHEAQQSAYPLASVYYARNNADAEPFPRIADFIEKSACRPHFQTPTLDPYSEEEARIGYLESKPVCYVVLGKPGLETERLSELIAAERNCVLISASKIFREIDANDESRKRRKADALECGCDKKEDIAWNLLVDRVNKRDVAHRGYVLEGLPLVQSYAKSCCSSAFSEGNDESKKSTETIQPNDEYFVITMGESATTEESLCTCEVNRSQKSISSEESSVQSKSVAAAKSLCSMLSSEYSNSFNCLTSSESNIKSSEMSDCACSIQVSDDSKCSKCSVSFQIEEVFKNWHMKPDVIVHITCPNDEILAKYQSANCDSFSSTEEFQKQSSDSDMTDFLQNKSISKLYDSMNSSTKIVKSLEYLECELQSYTTYAVKSIEKIVFNHNPQNVICIDGRYPIEHCFETIKIRLQILPLQVTIIPNKLSKVKNNLDDPEEAETENETSESEEYENDSFEITGDENLNLKRAFDEIKRSGILSDKFQWKLSRWKFLCPVELAKGRKIEGKKKLVVRFMNWVFFLSSNEAMEAFIENPRPYLLPPNPRPYCRIAVMGPRYSGKTKLSFDLARNLDSVVINVHDIISQLNRDAQKNKICNNTDYSSSSENISFNTTELVNALTESIENLSEQNCGDYFRNRGWILDDMILDFELCKKLLENDINIDTIIILFESDPYSNLINNWLKMQEENSIASEVEESNEDDFEEILPNYNNKSAGLSDYTRELEYFNNNNKHVASKLADIGIDVILCDLKRIDNLSEHIIRQIRKDYDLTAKLVESEEGIESEEEEDASEFSKDEISLYDSQETGYHLGNCNVYCPIALIDHKVLWKGKEKYRCLIDEKLYFMSSQSAMDYFISDYSKLQLPNNKASNEIPPLRIFIVGPAGSGKSTLANLISKEYGLAHVDFFQRFHEYMLSRGIDIKHFNSKLTHSNYEEESFSEDSFEEYELPENLHDQKYNIDKSIISNFFIKYKNEGALLPTLIANECVLSFFKPPFNDCGIIIDSFPNCIEDSEIILKNFAIPDIIIELKCNFNDLENRLLNKLMTEWKIEQDKKRNKEESQFSEVMNKYLEKKDIWIRDQTIIKYKERKLNADEYENNFSEELSTDLSESLSSSYISDFSSVINSEDEIEIEEMFYKLFPEPEPFDNWENEETVKENFSIQIEDNFEKSTQNLTFIFNFFKNKNIPWIKVDASPEINKVFVQILHILTPYSERNFSFFEKTYEIDNATAESLLSTGYYFLSSFGRFCPVQLLNRKNPFQMFLPLASQGKIFTVLHRQFIYFLAGEEALSNFKKHPLKYLNQDSQMPMIPAIISIIGPPKCGKTTLAKRFSLTYGFEVISRDEAINYVLNNFPRTNLSNSIRKNFQNGETHPPQQFAAAVKLFLSNPQCITQGCIFDGFPSSIEEVLTFASLAISPVVIVDLEAPLDFTLESLQNDLDFVFSSPSHHHEYDTWNADASEFRTWLDDHFGKSVKIDATKSKAAVWRRADENVRHRFATFLNYVREAGYDKVHDLEFLCVTSKEIQDRVSRFKLFCPSCVLFDKAFIALDVSKGRTGLVQFREHFYWFCEKHAASFTSDPTRFLRQFKNLELPDTYPNIIHDIVDLNNHCLSSRLANNGYCLVTYLDNLPNRKLTPGKTNLAVLHKNQLHLFCSESCRAKFCASFPSYAPLRIHLPRTLEPVSLRSLPTLGYLEQNLAAALAKAVNWVGSLRPKLPGMSSRGTAAVFIGAYLKARHRDAGDSQEAAQYAKALSRMKARCDVVREATEGMKRRINPWIVRQGEEKDGKVGSVDDLTGKEQQVTEHFELATVKFKRTSPTQLLMETDESLSDSMVPVPDARFDYLCEYFKPASKVPAFLNVVDIAGLVKGAAEGQGLGNAFLSHISACDGIFHLCRAFEDDDVTHIEGDVNPVRDLEIISEELRLKDIEFLHAHLEKLEKLVVRGNDKKLKPEYDCLLKVKQILVDDKNHIRFADWSLNDIEVLNKYLFLTSKPVIYLVNLSEKDYIRKKNKWLIKIKEWVDKNDPGAILIPFSGVFENKYMDMDEGERVKYVEESKVSSALDKIIVQGYKALQLQYFFTAGHDEVKAWTIQKGTKAPQAAGRIHTDFEKGFIMAEVMKYDDFKNEGTESAVKAAGKYRQQGRNYVVEDGDIILFKFNAGAGLKDPKKK